MAVKYYPEDKQDYGFIGMKFPLNGKGGGSSGGFFNMSRTTEDQAVTNYINLLLTRPGERYFQPEFGVGLQLHLFEQNTEAERSMIEFKIRQQAAAWLPYIQNISVDVKPRANVAGLNADPENAIQIVITFRVTNSLANKTITIFQNGGRISTIVE